MISIASMNCTSILDHHFKTPNFLVNLLRHFIISLGITYSPIKQAGKNIKLFFLVFFPFLCHMLQCSYIFIPNRKCQIYTACSKSHGGVSFD
jgi:hypothetical protein